jgi:hypothetical protein
MIPNWPIVLKGLDAIQDALKSVRPNWSAALEVWEHTVDYASHPILQPYEAGQPMPRVDQRVWEIRSDIDELRRALESKRLSGANRFIESAVEKIESLATPA